MGIATGLYNHSLISNRGDRFFSLRTVQTSSGAHPVSGQWVLGFISPRAKQQEHEADHSAPSSAKFKNDGGIPPLLHMPS